MKSNLTLTLLSFLVVVFGCDSSYKANITIRNKSLLIDTVKIVYEGTANEMEVSLSKPEDILVKSIATNDSFRTKDLKTVFNLNYKYRDINGNDTILFIKEGQIIQKEIYRIKENPMDNMPIILPY